MIKTAKQLKDLIRNRTGGDSNQSQVFLRIYMMERILERLSLSKYKDNFVLKGRMLISSLVGIDTRSTMDIDTTVTALPLTKDLARNMVEEIISVDIQDGISFRITKITDIMEGKDYEGIRFFIEGTLERLRQVIKIDISTGDEITPSAIEYEFPLILEKRTISLKAYNLETLLAEKLETVMVRAEANTRMRDFYDIHILFEQYYRDLNQEYMVKAFEATCRRRNSEKYATKLDEVLDMVIASKEMKGAWKRYQDENLYARNLEWEMVNGSVRQLKEIAVKGMSL